LISILRSHQTTAIRAVSDTLGYIALGPCTVISSRDLGLSDLNAVRKCEVSIVTATLCQGFRCHLRNKLHVKASNIKPNTERIRN